MYVFLFSFYKYNTLRGKCGMQCKKSVEEILKIKTEAWMDVRINAVSTLVPHFFMRRGKYMEWERDSASHHMDRQFGATPRGLLSEGHQVADWVSEVDRPLARIRPAGWLADLDGWETCCFPQI